MIPDITIKSYIRMVRNHGAIRGRDTIIELVAIGCAESGLDNMAIGRNDLNGTPPSSKAYASLGLGWLQHDSYWLQQDTIVNGVEWTIEQIRNAPAFSLDLLVKRPGMILFQGADKTYVNFKLWSAWPKKSDAFLAAVTAAYDAVAAES